MAHATPMPDAVALAPGRPGGSRPRDIRRAGRATARRTLRHAATGVAAIAMLHAALLGISSRADPYPDLGWTDRTRVMACVGALAPWVLTALILLWLAHQRPAAYVRAALALLLSGAAGLACTRWVPLAHLPEHGRPLFGEYLAMPGSLTGWYLLLALSVLTAVSSVRARVALVVTTVCAVTTSVLTSPQPAATGVLGAAVPLLAWFAAGRFVQKGAGSRGPTDAWEPNGPRRRRRSLPTRSAIVASGGPRSSSLRRAVHPVITSQEK